MPELTKEVLDREEKCLRQTQEIADRADYNGWSHSHSPLEVSILCDDALGYIERIRELETELAKLKEAKHD